MSAGCGTLTKGNHPQDDFIPCGTRLWLGKDAKSRTEAIHLCEKCKGLDETSEM